MKKYVSIKDVENVISRIEEQKQAAADRVKRLAPEYAKLITPQAETFKQTATRLSAAIGERIETKVFFEAVKLVRLEYLNSKIKVNVIEGMDGFDGLNVYKADPNNPDLQGELIDEFEYQKDEADTDVLERIKKKYHVLSYDNGTKLFKGNEI